MRASLSAIGFAVVFVSVGCGQSVSPTSPTSFPSGLSGPLGSARSTARAVAEVPLKGRLEGTFTVAGDLPVISVHLEAEGNATHLGRFTLDFHHVVDFRTLSLVPPATATLTAANGDSLTTSVAGVATPQDIPGVFFIVETHTITRGTGRFTGATGSFVIERLTTPPDPSIGTTSGSLDGTISLHE